MIIFLVLSIVLIAGYCFWQNNALSVSVIPFASTKVHEELNGYKIVQISDLHNKSFGKMQGRLIAKLRKIKPDLIVLTGDLVDSRRTDLLPAEMFAKEAAKIAPVYYVTGNHEHRLPKRVFEELLSRLSSSGVHILKNCGNKIEVFNGEGFYLLGIFDENLLDETLSDLSREVLLPGSFSILLAHQPQYIDKYAKEEIDLVFAGHAHGGQWRLPGFGGFFAPKQGFFPKYTKGLYWFGKTALVVSGGLGNSLCPIRIHNRPEIVVVELQKKIIKKIS